MQIMKIGKIKKNCMRKKMFPVDDAVTNISDLKKRKREFLACLFFGKNNEFIARVIFSIGVGAQDINWFKKVFSEKSKNSKKVILAVGRFFGNREINERDARIAKHAVEAGRATGIDVLDLVVVAKNGNRSLLEEIRGLQINGSGFVSEGCQQSLYDLIMNKNLFFGDLKVLNSAKKDGGGKIKIIDLFAGIGGFHLAFHNVGAECVFASEWDVSACKTYKHNFQKISSQLFKSNNFVGDITKIDPKSIPDFNVLCAGFPCQPFSQAGFKKGFNEMRGTLFFNIANIIKAKKPDAFFLENVRHLFKHDNGRTFEVIKNIIEKDLGYSFFYKIVKASDYGLPQHRPRIYMVGFKNREIDFKFPEPVSLKYIMSDVLGGKCDKKVGFTLRVGGRGTKINDRRNWDSYIVHGRVMRIGPKEGLKMQGFPDNFEFPVTNSQAMKQLGNSVAVPAIQAVAGEIIKVLKKYGKKIQ